MLDQGVTVMEEGTSMVWAALMEFFTMSPVEMQPLPRRKCPACPDHAQDPGQTWPDGGS